MEIIWPDFAIENLKVIFDFYTVKASKKVAHIIRIEILNATKQLINHPTSGQKEIHLQKLEKNFRYIVSGNYKIIYKVENGQIIISDVFDTRQNPDKMVDEKR